MNQPAARVADIALTPLCFHGLGYPHIKQRHLIIGAAVQGSGDTYINGRHAIRKGDPGIHVLCQKKIIYKTILGSATVFINGKPAHRMGDVTKHCTALGYGLTITGSPNVMIGGSSLAGFAQMVVGELIGYATKWATGAIAGQIGGLSEGLAKAGVSKTVQSAVTGALNTLNEKVLAPAIDGALRGGAQALFAGGGLKDVLRGMGRGALAGARSGALNAVAGAILSPLRGAMAPGEQLTGRLGTAVNDAILGAYREFFVGGLEQGLAAGLGALIDGRDFGDAFRDAFTSGAWQRALGGAHQGFWSGLHRWKPDDAHLGSRISSILGKALGRRAVTYVNGMNTNAAKASYEAQMLAALLGGIHVDYVYNDHQSFLLDLLECGLGRADFVTLESMLLAEMWRDRLADLDQDYGADGHEGVLHFAYSQGAIITSVAFRMLSPEEQARVTIETTFGGGELSDSALLNLINDHDGVPWSDVWPRLQAELGGSGGNNHVFDGSEDSPHALDNYFEEYQRMLEENPPDWLPEDWTPEDWETPADQRYPDS